MSLGRVTSHNSISNESPSPESFGCTVGTGISPWSAEMYVLGGSSKKLRDKVINSPRWTVTSCRSVVNSGYSKRSEAGNLYSLVGHRLIDTFYSQCFVPWAEALVVGRKWYRRIHILVFAGAVCRNDLTFTKNQYWYWENPLGSIFRKEIDECVRVEYKALSASRLVFFLRLLGTPTTNTSLSLYTKILSRLHELLFVFIRVELAAWSSPEELKWSHNDITLCQFDGPWIW